jgi:hypothetical protein
VLLSCARLAGGRGGVNIHPGRLWRVRGWFHIGIWRRERLETGRWNRKRSQGFLHTVRCFNYGLVVYVGSFDIRIWWMDILSSVGFLVSSSIVGIASDLFDLAGEGDEIMLQYFRMIELWAECVFNPTFNRCKIWSLIFIHRRLNINDN